MSAAAAPAERVKFVLEHAVTVQLPVPASDEIVELEAVVVDAETITRLRREVETSRGQISRDRDELERMRSELERTNKALEIVRVTLHRPSWTANQRLKSAIELTDEWALEQ